MEPDICIRIVHQQSVLTVQGFDVDRHRPSRFDVDLRVANVEECLFHEGEKNGGWLTLCV